MVSLRLSGLQKVASRCQIYLFLALALGSGALLPIQASFNAQLARSLGSVPLAADISYLTGSGVLVALLLSGRFGSPNWSALRQAPAGAGWEACWELGTSPLAPTLCRCWERRLPWGWW